MASRLGADRKMGAAPLTVALSRQLRLARRQLMPLDPQRIWLVTVLSGSKGVVLLGVGFWGEGR